MKQLFLFFACMTSMFASNAWSAENDLPHLPPDMDGYEYRAMLEKHPEFLPEQADELRDVLQ